MIHSQSLMGDTTVGNKKKIRGLTLQSAEPKQTPRWTLPKILPLLLAHLANRLNLICPYKMLTISVIFNPEVFEIYFVTVLHVIQKDEKEDILSKPICIDCHAFYCDKPDPIRVKLSTNKDKCGNGWTLKSDSEQQKGCTVNSRILFNSTHKAPLLEQGPTILQVIQCEPASRESASQLYTLFCHFFACAHSIFQNC